MSAQIVPLEPLAPDSVVHESAAQRRLSVDEWGRDARLISALTPFAALRWDVTVAGVERVAERSGALIIVNARRMALTPVHVAWALGDALGRPVRFVGRPDVVPFGPLLRRLGGLLALPAEIAGALRAGEVVVLGAAGTVNTRHAGAIDPALLVTALREQVPIHVAASTSSALSRNARVEVSPPQRIAGRRRGPLAEVELAEELQRRLQAMLHEEAP